MFDKRKTIHDGGILDVINVLSANGESGRLDMKAGTMEGVFFFNKGQLVDARVGHLTGFQAVNALNSVRDARFSFDRSVAPPLVSSITASERVVLKQFFGIETVSPVGNEDIVEYPDDSEVTMETRRIPVEAIQTPVPVATTSNFPYRGALILGVLFILIAVTAVALRNQYRERASPAAVATTEQPASPTVADSPTVAEAVQPNNAPAPVEQPAAAQNLTGKWSVVNTVEKTSYRSFQHLKIGFDLSISQNGNRFTGNGEKVSENGRSLPEDSRTPIQVKGLIKGDRVEATFFEDGAARKTNGRFVWRIDETGRLSGTFVSTAARTSGKSAAKREL